MKIELVRRAGGAIALLAVVSLGLMAARAEQVLPVACKMPVHVKCNVNESGCDNSPGPQITLDGTIALGGIGANLIFENNVKGTQSALVETWATNVALLPLGSAIVIPKQPVLCGVGGNPHIYIQFLDGKCNALTEELYLGRCVQGLSLEGDFLNDVVGASTVDADGCSNHPGPVITMGGQIVLSGLKARFILRNNVKGTHWAMEYRDVDLIIEGTPVVIPKSPHQGGAGGNPLILLQFLQCDETPIGDLLLLGRCNKI
jgi:hypothetical protein